jgi:hypothetical protein
VFIFDLKKYDRKGIWEKNMKKFNRKVEEKKKKRKNREKKEKRETKGKMESTRLFYYFSYIRQGHQYGHVVRGVHERRV